MNISERNNVNSLDGKSWIKNAINFWELDSINDDSILEAKIINFAFKKRTTGKIYSNLIKKNNSPDLSFDLTITKITDKEDIDKCISRCFRSAYNSYHFILMDNIIKNNKLLSKYLVDTLTQNDLEYRGRTIIYFKKENKYLTAFIFLNRLLVKDKIKSKNNLNDYKIKNHLKKEKFIYSRSKIDKIGLLHPAPFSYNDIEALCDFKGIYNSIILDPFIGISSTIIAAQKGKNYTIGIELNKKYIKLSYERFKLLNLDQKVKDHFLLITGDSFKKIKDLKSNIDFVITSPPYFNILKNTNKGVRHDKSQSRQGVDYYSDSKADIGNLDNYQEYIKALQKLFAQIRKKLKSTGEVYIIISDFTVNKKEMDVHSDIIQSLSDIGYTYIGTSYIIQNQKTIYPFGYPYKIVLNHIFQYIISFKR